MHGVIHAFKKKTLVDQCSAETDPLLVPVKEDLSRCNAQVPLLCVCVCVSSTFPKTSLCILHIMKICERCGNHAHKVSQHFICSQNKIRRHVG